jgi:hypothetical protein
MAKFIAQAPTGLIFKATADDAVEKEAVGKRWAATSQSGRCVFVQVSKGDSLKRSLEKQLLDALDAKL